MRRLLMILMVAGLFVAGGAGAAHGSQYYEDIATVTHAEPIVRYVRIATPRRECWDEEVRRPVRNDSHEAGSMIIGGVIGGVAGHQIGRHTYKGRGTGAATLAGTLIGAAIGHDHAQHRRGEGERVTHETRCNTYTDYHEEERVDGYRVTYQYRGQTFESRLPYDPGSSMRVRVQVTPIRD